MSKRKLFNKAEVENVCKMNIDIPFDSEDKAQIVLDVLKVDSTDPESDDRSKENIYVEDKTLHVHFTTNTPKNLRSCSSSFYDKLILITDLIEEFSEYPKNNN